MRAKKTVNQSSYFPVRRTGSYRHKKSTGKNSNINTVDIRLKCSCLMFSVCYVVQMMYQSRQWCGQYVIPSKPDVLGVCHVEAGSGNEKVTMVCDEEDDLFV